MRNFIFRTVYKNNDTKELLDCESVFLKDVCGDGRCSLVQVIDKKKTKDISCAEFFDERWSF